MERINIVKAKGSPLTLFGGEIKIGEKAPSFKVLDHDLKDVSSNILDGKVRLFASVPSLDTPVCDMEIHNFNKEAVNISKDVSLVFLSMDLPFAQKRFCQENEIENVKTYSDHKDADFGTKYGVLIKELRLLARAIFVIDKNNIVQYVEYVPELTSHPDYKAALAALKKIAE